MKNKIAWNRSIVDDFDDSLDTTNQLRPKKDLEYRCRNKDKNCRVIYDENNFKCVRCNTFITADRILSGVNNRNHCPFCLWSRHMDLLTPGDRKADCKSRMEPIGLTMKQSYKRYCQDNSGELMLIHICTGCGKCSINRIAADDVAQVVFQLYLNSCVGSEELQNHLKTKGIFLLDANEYCMVQSQLFGCSSFMGYSITEPV